MPDERDAVPYDENLLLQRACAACGKELAQTDHGGPNQMDNAMDLEIRGYWGTTVFDGTDIHGCCLLGFVCDDCGRRMMERMTCVSKYDDRRIKPGTPEWDEFAKSCLPDSGLDGG